MNKYTQPEYNRSALFTIDMQCDLLDDQPFGIKGTSEILPAVKRLTEFFRSRNEPIIHIVRIYKQDGSNVDLCRRESIENGAQLLLAGSSGSQMAEPLLPSSKPELDVELLIREGIQKIGTAEWFIYKPRWGAFYRTPLEEHLRKLGASTLVFAGCNFPNCPRTSIYEASERDFRVVAISDAISGLYSQGRCELENIRVALLDAKSYISKVDSELV